MNTTDISVVVLTYNAPQYVEGLLTSLQKQTLQPKEVIVIDNSTEATTAEEVERVAPEAQLYEQETNLGFSGGMNVGIEKATAPTILILNQDMELEPDCLEQLAAYLTTHKEVGALAPKLKRFEEGNTIDAMGLTLTKARRYTNIGEGAEDIHQYDGKQVFGVSGTAILFQRAALHAISFTRPDGTTEYFDEDFVAYKDDVDMSYRLRHAGWDIAIAPEAIAYHKRTVQEKQMQYNTGIFSARKEKSEWLRINSWRNHLFVLLKNEPLPNLVLHFPWIVFQELQKLVFMLLFERSTYKGVPSLLQLLPLMLKKRRHILKNSSFSAKDIRKWVQ